MNAETKLLAEVIRNAPYGANWFLSTDSYDGIKYILGSLLNITKGDWIVNITEVNRATVAELIEKHGLAMKIVHTSVESKERTVLLRGYDGMAFIGINEDFYKELNQDNIPATLDIELD
ncbi:hypothetical protein [Hymenobacter sp.]|jgi:hypothetical protein|uniref:hypothetical protein n=1 Tax=Hymenobacter sp. TaxID=1898978 RepID=UPI002ED87632